MPADRSLAGWGFWAKNRMRLTYALLAVLAIWLIWADVRPWAISTWPGAVGAALVVLGLSLRAWSAGFIAKDRELAMSGPYALSRHPLYLGSFLLVLGLACTLGSVKLLLIACVVFALLYTPVIKNEERLLAQQFGDAWVVFCQQVSWFGPKRGPIALSGRWSLAQWRENREYEGTLLGLGLLLILQIWAFSA